MSIADLAVRVAADVKNYQSGMDSIAAETEKTTSWIEDNWLKVGVAAAAVGGAMEVAARKQAPLTEQTRQLAAAMDTTEGEMRDLALATTDVTFPLEDVLDLMESGRQQGIKSADQLQEYAKFWDMVGDATGENAVALGDAGVALRAVGIAAGEEEKALDAFGYITQETTGDVKDFLTFLERTGPELRELGGDVDDAAAIMGILEHELGMTARTARTEFRKAVNEADGDMGEMLETLGISEEQFEKYSDAVKESSDVIERNAEIHGESYTAMEKMQQAASEMMFRYGDLIGVVGDFAPLMMGLGPILKGVMVAKNLLAGASLKALIPAILGAVKATWAFTAALLANPITWVVLLIAGLVAAIVLLWKNWDQVSDWLSQSWDNIKQKAGEVITGISDWFSQLPGKLWGWLKNAITRMLEWRANMISAAKEAAKGVVDSVVRWISELPGRLLQSGKDAITNLAKGVRDAASDTLKGAVDSALGFLNKLNPFTRQSPSLVDQVEAGVQEIMRSYRKVDTMPDFELPGFEQPAPPDFGRAFVNRTDERIGGEVTVNLQHAFEGVPPEMNENKLADLVKEAFDEPAIQRKIDGVLEKIVRSTRKPGGAI